MSRKTTPSPLLSDRRATKGLILIAVVFGIFVLAGGGFLQRWLTGGGRTVRVTFANAQQLREIGFMRSGSDVRIDGVSVGRVKSIVRDPGSRTATATLKLKDAAGTVYADARADLRWQTLLGANFYIALDRGTPASGALGDRTIPASHTTNEVEVEDITSVLRGRAKQGLRALPEQMATALRDPAPLADLAASVARIADHATTGLRAVQGQEPASDLRELISSTAAVVGALDRPADHLRQVVAGAAATVTVTGDHSTDIRSTLEQAPAALRATDTTLQRIDGTLSELDPVVRNLQDPAPRVAPVLAGLRPTVIDARGLLNRAVPLFRALRPTSRSLASAARSGQPLLHDVAPALKQLSGKVLPYLNDVSPTTKHTTAEMIGPAIAVYANSGGLVDDVGRAIRFPLSIGSSSLYGPCQTFINNPEADKAIVCRSVTDALKTYLSYNPLGGTPGSDTGGGSARKLLKGGK